MQVITISQARANLFKLIDQVSECAEPIMLFGKRNNAVLVSEEEWRSIQETLYLTTLPGVVDSVKEARQSTPGDWVTPDKIEW